MNFRLRLPLLHCAVVCIAAGFSLPALAADGAMDDLLRVLRDRGAISASEYEVLKNSAAADKERASQEVSEATKDTVKVSTGKSGLKVSSGDGGFKFQLGGRAMIDAAFYDKDKTRLGNGAELRRARLFAKGTVYHDWFYKAQVDFAGNSTSLKDFYLGYSGFDSGKVKIGHFKEPFSLEELTSSKYITFMERGLPNAFSPGRNTGLSASTHGDKWGAAAGYFFEGVKNDNSPKSQGWGATGR
ncbi:MAG: OprO/OprP family phosphate-selective porin, partial [Thiogranum sp.]